MNVDVQFHAGYCSSANVDTPLPGECCSSTNIDVQSAEECCASTNVDVQFPAECCPSTNMDAQFTTECCTSANLDTPFVAECCSPTNIDAPFTAEYCTPTNVDIQCHTELTELTDIISLDVNIFCAFRGFCVPFSNPLIIRVHRWHLCPFYLTQNSLNSRILSLMTAPFLCFPWVLCDLTSVFGRRSPMFRRRCRIV